ncbi:hypothetical protein ACGF5S_19425 [Nocardia nova]|uniref:nSTAND1 domain-containing NTPase n=1 Tax=Nocardia nova TaxID=37330 RepID=UPI003711ABF8
MTGSVELFPIAIGEFDSAEWERIDGIDANLAGFLDAFDGFVCHVVEWQRTAPRCCGKAPTGQELLCSSCSGRKSDHYRGHDDVSARLRQWSDGDPSTRSILYWIGHGWSDENQATLIHSKTSPEHAGTEGIRPERIAEAIRSRFAVSPQPWVVVMIEACQAARFVRLLQNALNESEYEGMYLLVSPASDNGAVRLGHLRTMLRTAFAAEDVLLDRLAKTLHDTGLLVKQSGPIPDDVVALERRIRLPANISVDAREQLAIAVAKLPRDVQRHFITKAHGGLGSFERVVLNEQSWYFEGRESDTQQVVSWLHESSSGVLVITGPPGSGKSAFLGNLIVHANPALREALRHTGLLPASPERLPDNAFDVCLTLTGAPTEEVVMRLAAVIGATLPDHVAGKPISAAGQWLAQQMRTLAEPITIVVDALDEAVSPKIVASSILRPLGQVPTVRLLVGTRKSTNEQVDTSATDQNLLHALGVSDNDVVRIRTDRQAIRRFVRHQVTSRMQQDRTLELDVDRFADAVAQRDPHFLMAQLAVHEVLSDPDRRSYRTWDHLLSLSHQGVFNLAVSRLIKKHQAYRAVLVGLAFSSGLGLPIHDGVWRTIAQGIENLEPHLRSSITDSHIENFLNDAAPYVIVDNEHDQTVYRFSHRTFAEHFTGNSDTVADREVAIVQALISAHDHNLEVYGHTTPHNLVNPYIRQYLSTHVANGGREGWSLLARHEGLIRMLSLDQIAADAQRSAAGRFSLPPIIEGITNARDWLNRVHPDDYAFAVALATARVTGTHEVSNTNLHSGAMAKLRWAAVQRKMHLRTLTSDASSVRVFATISAPDNNSWLVSAGQSGAINVWNPTTGKQIQTLREHSGTVTALTVFSNATAGPVLVSAGSDSTIRFWDVTAGATIGSIPDCPPITAMEAVRDVQGRHLLVCASSSTIAILNPADGRILRKYSEHSGEVTALAVVTDPFQGDLLVSAAKDGSLRLWSPETGHTLGSLETTVLTALTTLPSPHGMWPMVAGATAERILLWDYMNWRHTDIRQKQPDRVLSSFNQTITALATLGLPGRRPLLAGAAQGTISVWDLDLTQKHPVAQLSSRGSDTRSVTALTAVPLADGGSLLASANHSTIRLWNPVAWRQHLTVGPRVDQVTDHGPVTTLTAFSPTEGKTLLATAAYDDSIELWDCENGGRLGPPGQPADYRGRVTALTEVPATDGRSILVSGSDRGAISVWNPGIDQPHVFKAMGNSPVTALVAVPAADKNPMLASADSDGVVCLWDLATGQTSPIATLSLHFPVTALATMYFNSQKILLAIADEIGNVRVFDSMKIIEGHPISRFSADDVAIRALAVVTDNAGEPLLAAAGVDGKIRLFDPVNSTAEQPGTALTGHRGAVTALACWPLSGRRTLLISGGRDRTIRIWDFSRTTPLRVIPVDAPVTAIAALPGNQLSVALEDGLLVIGIDMTITQK